MVMTAGKIQAYYNIIQVEQYIISKLTNVFQDSTTAKIIHFSMKNIVAFCTVSRLLAFFPVESATKKMIYFSLQRLMPENLKILKCF